MEETRVHPIWKEVAELIARRVELEGYGFLISHEELFKMLEIGEPKTIPEAMKQRLEILKKVEETKSILLYDYNMCLENQFNRGYVVLKPDDQVSKGYDRQYDKARKKVRKAIDLLNHVNHDLLSQNGIDSRDRNLNKAVFVLTAFNKRKLPEVKRRQIA